MRSQLTISVREVVERAPRACGNRLVVEQLRGCIESVGRGEMVCDGFAPQLPADFQAIVRTGKESGNLVAAMEQLGGIYRDKSVDRFRALVAAIPVLLYVAAAGTVIYVIVGLMTGYVDTLEGLM